MPEQLPLHSFAREIIDTPVTQEMSESFLAYSLSVITARAIPDVRDGLKPVQRRILYSMQQMGLRPDRPHRKCAHVVGDTMARFHPHGDSAIYETLVRMAQSFARNITFVDPQGNFGSLDDPPAAYRYTECRRPPAYLRRRDHRADLPAGIAAQPARQRHHRHRGRHGNEHAHAQPARGVRSDRARAQQTPAAAHHRGAHGRAPRPRLPERRHRHRREHPRRLRDRPGHRAHPCPHRGREAHPHARRARRHRAPLSRGPRTRRGPHQGAPQGQQAQRCSGRQEPVRPQARLEDPDRTTRRRRPATRHERAV